MKFRQSPYDSGNWEPDYPATNIIKEAKKDAEYNRRLEIFTDSFEKLFEQAKEELYFNESTKPVQSIWEDPLFKKVLIVQLFPGGFTSSTPRNDTINQVGQSSNYYISNAKKETARKEGIAKIYDYIIRDGRTEKEYYLLLPHLSINLPNGKRALYQKNGAPDGIKIALRYLATQQS